MNAEERATQAIELIGSIIEARFTSPRKEMVKALLESEFGILYFSAPASSREEYHYAWPGGLASHSINVYRNLRKLNSAFELNFNEESMALVSIFHDIGKASLSSGEESFYTPQTEEWRRNRGQKYGFNVDDHYMTTHLRSIYLLQKFGIKLEADEFLAIYLNDGQYLDENKTYRLKEGHLALYLHMADRIALEQEKA